VFVQFNWLRQNGCTVTPDPCNDNRHLAPSGVVIIELMERSLSVCSDPKHPRARSSQKESGIVDEFLEKTELPHPPDAENDFHLTLCGASGAA